MLGRSAGDGWAVAEGLTFVVAAFGASTSWQLLLAGGGNLAGRLLAGARGRLATALVARAVIAALAVWLLLRANSTR